jgi:multicomponent Na+:H+ antiporter subunit E
MGAWLMVVWLILWGRVDAATLAGGGVVISLGYVATRLPAIPVVTRVRPVALIVPLLEFAVDLLVSSVVIGWHALRAPRAVRGAIVEVETRSQSEIVLLAVTASISLRPGTIVLDVDPRRPALLIHGMPVRDEGEAGSLRRSVLATERRLLRGLVPTHDSSGREEGR